MNHAAPRTPCSADFAEYLRVLPKLLQDGDERRVALIHRGKLISIWDTAGDALQAGFGQFGADAGFLTQPVSRRDLQTAGAAARPHPNAARS